jgi:hypothetical protein
MARPVLRAEPGEPGPLRPRARLPGGVPQGADAADDSGPPQTLLGASRRQQARRRARPGCRCGRGKTRSRRPPNRSGARLRWAQRAQFVAGATSRARPVDNFYTGSDNGQPTLAASGKSQDPADLSAMVRYEPACLSSRACCTIKASSRQRIWVQATRRSSRRLGPQLQPSPGTLARFK